MGHLIIYNLVTASISLCYLAHPPATIRQSGFIYSLKAAGYLRLIIVSQATSRMSAWLADGGGKRSADFGCTG